MDNFIGKDLGRYHILEQLGEGGMATVYKAFDTRLETDVAVKIIRIDRFTPEVLARALKRFEREAKALAKLTHPNIVKVMDYGEYEGQPYLVMPFLPGGNLKQYLREHGRTPWQEAVRLLLPIAQALNFAHSQNIIHRDVKPANILLTQSGEPMLTDFGVAKVIEEEATMDLTGTAAAVGTPEYMAPEQTGKNIDHRVDIYALGVVLYEMITGRRPFEADTPLAVLIKQASEPLPRPKNFIGDLPDSVEHILLKALAKSPADRYGSMGEFVRALENVGLETRTPVTPAPRTVVQPSPKVTQNDQQSSLPRPRKARGWVIGGGIIFALILIVGCIALGVREYSTFFKPTQAAAAAPAIPATEAPAAVALPVKQNTPYPDSLAAISLENATQIQELARWGKGIVSRIVYSPDGTMLAAVSSLGIYLFDSQSLAEIRLIETGSWPSAVAFSPDGNTIATTGLDNAIQMYRVSDGALIRTFGGGVSGINSITFSPDGTLLAAGGWDYIVRLWNVSDGSLFQGLTGHTDGIAALSFAPSGQFLASGSTDKTVRLWDISGGTLYTTLNQFENSIADVVYSPDGSLLAVSEYGGRNTLWRTAAWQQQCQMQNPPRSQSSSLSFSPNGTFLAGDSRLMAMVWNTANCEAVVEIGDQTGESVDFSPDGQSLAAKGADNSVNIIRTSDWTIILSKVVGDTFFLKRISSDAQSVEANCGQIPCSLRISDGVERASAYKLPDGYYILDSSADGRLMLSSTSANQDLSLWNASDGSLIQTITGFSDSNYLTSLAFSPNGLVLALGASDGSITAWNTNNQTMLYKITGIPPLPDGSVNMPYQISFSPDGAALSSMFADGRLYFWNASDGSFITRLNDTSITSSNGNNLWLGALAYSPDGSTLATGYSDGRICFWSVPDYRLINQVSSGDTGGVSSLVFSPDQTLLAGGFGDGKIYLWQVSNLALLNTLQGQFSGITKIIFSTNMDRFFTGAYDGTIRIWGIPH